jgi:site-specific DNA-methyltransferase (adenine-specific)
MIENLNGVQVTDKIRLFNCDNMEFMKEIPDNYYDLACIDIPYGLGDKLTQGGTWANKYKKGDVSWDVLPKKVFFNELFRISKNWIIFGGNYAIEFLPNCRNFIAWHKPYMDGMHSMSNVELALTSFDRNAKKVSINKDKGGDERIHITQKPVALYKWILDKYAKKGDKIFDSHLGSMSIAIACHDYGFELDGTELDPEYFEKGLKRVKNHISQLRLF